ncbi:MAG: hypothetical protein ACREV2_16860 [Burkholderiales bacterium]
MAGAVKIIAVAAALELGSTLAIAAEETTRMDRPGASEGAPYGKAKGHDKQEAKRHEKEAKAHENYWQQHSKDGYMTREQAMAYKGDNPIDWRKLDADADSRVSRTEWTEYHSALKSDGSKDSGLDERSGAAGRTGQ